jgi:hypothetical protein
VVDFAGRTDLARQHNRAFFAQHFAGDVAALILLEIGVENRVGDQVTDFVRMAL